MSHKMIHFRLLKNGMYRLHIQLIRFVVKIFLTKITSETAKKRQFKTTTFDWFSCIYYHIFCLCVTCCHLYVTLFPFINICNSFSENGVVVTRTAKNGHWQIL